MSVAAKNCSNPSCTKGSEVKLQMCSQCHSVSYCSVDCQKQHWRAGHKHFCRKINNQYDVPDPTRPKNINEVEYKPEWAADNKKNRKLLKELDGLGKNILKVEQTAYGTVAPGKPLPKGVPSNFHLKQHAHLCFFSGRQSDIPSGKTGIYKHEKAYLEYFEEIVKNEVEWMTFFKHKSNYEIAEHTCGILGTLATIYRQRGNSVSYVKCEEVLDIEGKVLSLYKASADAIGDQEIIYCHSDLQYKYNLIRINLYMYTDRLNHATSYIRKCLEYEVERNLDIDHQITLPSMSLIGMAPTARNVMSLTDSKLKELVLRMDMINKLHINSEDEKAMRTRVELKKCEACNKVESVIDEFKACSRCFKAHYCSRDCQKKHYKIHKKSCPK